MKRTPAYEFADESAQSSSTIPLEWASAVASQRQPSFKALRDNTFLKDIQGFMHHMLQHKIDPPSGGGSTDVVLLAQVFYGIIAMEKLFEDRDKRIKETADASIDLGVLKVFDAFAGVDWQVLQNPWCKAPTVSASTTGKEGAQEGWFQGRFQHIFFVQEEEDSMRPVMIPATLPHELCALVSAQMIRQPSGYLPVGQLPRSS